ncbi:hypothetical protein EV121DRAFT_255979 [Schizophyllum commune]
MIALGRRGEDSGGNADERHVKMGGERISSLATPPPNLPLIVLRCQPGTRPSPPAVSLLVSSTDAAANVEHLCGCPRRSRPPPTHNDIPKPLKEPVVPEPVILAPHLRKTHNFPSDAAAVRPSSSSSTSSTHPYATRSPEITTRPPLSRPMSSSSTSQHSQRQSPVLMRPPQSGPISPPVMMAQGQAFGLDALVAASEERRRMDTSDFGPHSQRRRTSGEGASRSHHLHALADHVSSEERRQEQAIFRHHQQRELSSRARSSSSSTSYAQSPPSRSPTDVFPRDAYANSMNASISPRTMTVPLGPPPYPMTSNGSDPIHAGQPYRAGDPEMQLSPLSVPQKRRHSQSVSSHGSHGSPPLPPPITVGPGRRLDLLMHDREHEQERIQREAERRGMERRRMDEERRREKELAAYAMQQARHRLPQELAANNHGDKVVNLDALANRESSSRQHRRDQPFEFDMRQQPHPMQIQRQIMNPSLGYPHTNSEAPPTIQRMPELHQQSRLSLSPTTSRQLPAPRGLAYDQGELERERLERQMMERERVRAMERDRERIVQEQVLMKERELAAREARVKEQEMRLRAMEEQRVREARMSTSEVPPPGVTAEASLKAEDTRPTSHGRRTHDRHIDSLSPATPRVVPQTSSSTPHPLEQPGHRRLSSGQEPHDVQHHSSSSVQGPNQPHARHHSRQHPPQSEPSSTSDSHHLNHHHAHDTHRPVQLTTASRPPPGSRTGRAIANARRDSGGSEGTDAADMPPRRGAVKHEDMTMDVDLPPPTLPRVTASATPNPSSIPVDTHRAPPSSKPPVAQARMISPPSATHSHGHDAMRRSISQGTPPTMSAPRLISSGRSRSSHTQMSTEHRSVSRDAGPTGPSPDDADEWLLEQAEETTSHQRSLSPPAKRMKFSPPEDDKPSRSAKRASSTAGKRSKSKRAESVRSRTADDEEDALLDLERELDSVPTPVHIADAMDVDKELEDLVAPDPTPENDVDDELMSLVEDKDVVKGPHHARAPSTQPSHGKRSHSPAPRPPALPRVVSLPSTAKEEEDRASMPPPPLKKGTGGKKPAESTASKSRSKKGSSSRSKAAGEASQSHKAKAKSASKSKARKVDDGPRSSEPPAGTPPPPPPPKKSHKKGAGAAATAAAAAAAAAHSRSASATPAEKEKKADDAKDRRKEEEHKEEDDDRLYCICRTTYDETLNMIACDRCDDWYHTMCVDLSDQEVELIDQFICPLCIKKHPKLNLRTTYKQRCLNGLRHPNPNSPSACHKPARGAFSKYCSDECGVQCMRARIENWERSGGNAGKLWDSLKHADRSEGVVMRVEQVQEKPTEPPLCKTEVIKPVVPKAERDIQHLTKALDEIANLRENLERGMEVVRYREKLLDLAIGRQSRLQSEHKHICGWDMRMCFGDDDWMAMAEEVWDSYEDDEEGDQQQQDWWCDIQKCTRHAGWADTRETELLIEKNSKRAALSNLATRERALRQRLEDLLEAQHSPNGTDGHEFSRLSSECPSGGAARSRSTKKKTSVA